MKKITFYSMTVQNEKTAAVAHEGYTDGIYNYYRLPNSKTWHAIHPLCGLSVAYGYTRNEAQKNANALDTMEKVNSIMEARGDSLIKKFKSAILVARIEKR